MQTLKNALHTANALNNNAVTLNVTSAKTTAMYAVLQAKQAHKQNVALHSSALITQATHAYNILNMYANCAVYLTARKQYVTVKCTLNMHNKLAICKHITIANNVSIVYTNNAIILRFKQA
jgi:glycyl-tRNA synthetase alpha subunit